MLSVPGEAWEGKDSHWPLSTLLNIHFIISDLFLFVFVWQVCAHHFSWHRGRPQYLFAVWINVWMHFLNFSEHFVVGVPLYKIKNLHFVFDPHQIAPFSSLPCHAQLFKRLCSVYKKVKSILSYYLLGKNFVSRNLFHHKDFYPHVTLRKI